MGVTGPESEAKLANEQTAVLYQAMPLAIAANLLNAAVLIFVEWEMADHRLALLWLVLILSTILGRYLLMLSYRRRKEESRADWKRRFDIGAIITGAVWGSSALLLFPDHSIAHQIFLAFILGGISVGSVTTLASSLFALHGFPALTLLPITVRFFMIGTGVTHAMGVMILLFLVMISISGRRIHANSRQNIELRLKSEHQENIIQQQAMEQRAILDNAPVGIWLAGGDGRYRFVNKTFCDAVGVDEERFLTTTDLAELLGEETAASCLESDRECFENETPQTSYESLKFVDGKMHLMEITKTKVRDNQGEVVGAIGIGVDITERENSEAKLRKLSQAVEQAGESVIITDKKGRIEYVNPSFTRITGYQPEEVMKQNPNILKSGKQSSEYYKRLWDTIGSGKVWHNSVIDRRKDGKLYPAMMTISPIHDEHGKITHYVGIQQDMSDLNMLEEQFRQAQKMEALGTLIGGIAHDFNNILTGISGNIALAKFEVEDRPELEDKLKIAEELSYKASDMIKQLMVFSRKGLIEMRPFGLISFIGSISSLIKTSIPENIRFDFSHTPDELVVNGDSTQIEQVLINLLNNARDAVAESPDPQIMVQIDRFEADDEFIGRHPAVHGRIFAHIAIIDNGSGISEADLEHIFEPFFTTKEVGLGTGLGLSMAYGAIQSHGGAIEVESTPGEGTSFQIYLPLLQEKTVEATNESRETVAGNGELILIVDDNADIRNTLQKVLESLNYRVIEAVDGLEAVDIFTDHQHEIDLVIMDVVMPRLGGVKAADRIARIRPDVKLIFATGYDRDDALKNEMPPQGFDVIPKPFGVANLSSIIRKQLDN